MRDDIRHPKEAQAEKALLSNPLFAKAAKAFSKWLVGAPSMARSLARKFTVTADTHPRIWALYKQALARMELDEEYPLFLDFNYDIASDVFEHNQSYALVLSSAAVELLNDRELLALFGSALSYIKFGHLKYLNMFKALDVLPLPKTVNDALAAPFLDWMQAAEYTADRAGAYTAESREAAINVLRIDMGAGTEYPELDAGKMSCEHAQVVEISDMTMIGRTLLKHLLSQTDCPWGVDRIKELSAYDGVPW